ncbi:sensor histidine kinase [Arenibacterium sp. CAU 1754]
MRTHLLRSMPMRLALGLVALFVAVSLASLAVTYLVTRESLERSMREDLAQDIAGFRAAPSAGAVATLIDAQADVTDPERMILSYFAPNGRHYGNVPIRRNRTGYHVVSRGPSTPTITGPFMALTTRLYGGELTIARSRSEIEELRKVFIDILWLSLLPTVLLALSGGLYLAWRSARRVAVIENTLEDLTTGNLSARTHPLPGWPDDLSSIADKVDRMASAQENSVAALRQVSADIAHDLKTPIQRVSVHLDELGQSETLSDEDRELAQQASQEIDGVVSIFQSLLQIAQIESGSPKTRFAPVDLCDLAKTFGEIYEPAAQEVGRSLSVDTPDAPVMVTGDRDLLGQVLANLIENALRHTQPGTAITVRAGTEYGRPCLSVADTGPGIPEVERENVLQRLYRLERSRTTPGSGLGLSLVSVIAALHGASVELSDNAPGLVVALRFS